MKPYGRGKKINGAGLWKKDYHLHRKGRKLENWWEGITDFLSRSTMKQKFKKEVEDDLL